MGVLQKKMGNLSLSIENYLKALDIKKTFDKGKVFYTSIGHDPMEFEKHPDAWKLLTRGFIWAARD